MTDTTAGEGVALAKELERLAECEGGIRGGSQQVAETMRHAARFILAAQPSAGAQGEVVGTVDALTSLLRTGGTTWFTNEQEWALKSAIKILSASTQPTGNAVQDALIAGFLHGVGRAAWEDMHDYIAVCAVDYAKGVPLPNRATPAQPDTGDVAALRETKNIIDSYFMDDDYDANGALRKVSAVLDAALSKPNAPGTNK